MAISPEAVAASARRWLGTPYRHQASTLGAGCDCLGLLRGIWRDLYGTEPMAVPPYRADGRDGLGRAILLDAARALMDETDRPGPGAAVIFALSRAAGPKHCGIVIGPDRFIHAQERLGVVEANLTEPWRRRIAATFTFPDPLRG